MGTRTLEHTQFDSLQTIKLALDEITTQREQLEQAFEKLAPLSAESALAATVRITAMTEDDLISFFDGYRLRVAAVSCGVNTHATGTNESAASAVKADIAPQVQHLNEAIERYDRALLRMRIAELLCGHLDDTKSAGVPVGLALCLEMVETMIESYKAHESYRIETGGTLTDDANERLMLRAVFDCTGYFLAHAHEDEAHAA